MSFNVGDNVGPYKIIEQLGQGGMATVYKAYHASLDRYVALKALHAAFGEDATFSARFQREARVVAKLEHPHIVPVYDYAQHEGRPYLIMKFIEGDTLKARLNKGPLTSEEIEKVVDSVGSALAYAHKQGILHRDIKPSNVLVAKDGEMYLADFGLARIAQSGESTLSSDMIMGTPQYISPEQAMGKKDLDDGTDIYSFAVMLYEMVVGGAGSGLCDPHFPQSRRNAAGGRSPARAETGRVCPAPAVQHRRGMAAWLALGERLARRGGRGAGRSRGRRHGGLAGIYRRVAAADSADGSGVQPVHGRVLAGNGRAHGQLARTCLVESHPDLACLS